MKRNKAFKSSSLHPQLHVYTSKQHLGAGELITNQIARTLHQSQLSYLFSSGLTPTQEAKRVYLNFSLLTANKSSETSGAAAAGNI